jgi:Uma2 family endonuclease
MGATMTAEPRAKQKASSSRWPIPPEEGWTADDLDRIPDLPPHTELIDGSLVFVSPQKSFHGLVLYLLEHGLRSQAPREYGVHREMTVTLGKRNRPEPDILILRADAMTVGANETSYAPEDVLLAVEVVSPDSEDRDRKVKPAKYAEAGIPNFWRVEKGEGRRPVVHVFRLDPVTAQYGLVSIHDERLVSKSPFEIDIDLTEIDKL